MGYPPEHFRSGGSDNDILPERTHEALAYAGFGPDGSFDYGPTPADDLAMRRLWLARMENAAFLGALSADGVNPAVVSAALEEPVPLTPPGERLDGSAATEIVAVNLAAAGLAQVVRSRISERPIVEKWSNYWSPGRVASRFVGGSEMSDIVAVPVVFDHDDLKRQLPRNVHEVRRNFTKRLALVGTAYGQAEVDERRLLNVVIGIRYPDSPMHVRRLFSSAPTELTSLSKGRTIERSPTVARLMAG